MSSPSSRPESLGRLTPTGEISYDVRLIARDLQSHHEHHQRAIRDTLEFSLQKLRAPLIACRDFDGYDAAMDIGDVQLAAAFRLAIAALIGLGVGLERRALVMSSAWYCS